MAVMDRAHPMVELWRGDLLESAHAGHAVVCDPQGQILRAWGNPETVIYPRSSCKMIQALPLIESGAADAVGLSEEQLALACASHDGAPIHVRMVTEWLAQLGLGESDLRCGPQEPSDHTERDRLIRTGEAPCQIHNNCSGKHSGFLTLTQHLKAGPEYIEIDHPVQRAIKAATEEVTGETSPGYGIDGCSAPNFATTVHGLARAMGRFAAATEHGDTRSRAMYRLSHAMAHHPELVEGDGSACTELMRAMGGRVAIKYGAEAVYTAILPEQRIGIALKIVDGGKRAAEAAIAQILVSLGVLDTDHPATSKWRNAIQRSRRGFVTGSLRIADSFK